MPGKYSNNDEKACILAWIKEKVPIKIICKCKRRARSTIMKLLSSAKRLYQAMQFQSIKLEVEREERLHMLQTSF